MSDRTRLLLHVGLPKTGASALQIWCHRNREGLRRRGIDFPKTGGVPKHQFLAHALHSSQLEWLQTSLAESQANTILLSAEALTMRLYDFRPAALDSFRRNTRHHEVTVFMITREVTAWTRSYYKQLVITPALPELHWGTPLDYQEFCSLSRVQRLCNVAALEEDLRAAFGATVVMARYEAMWMDDFLKVLAVSDVADLHPLTQENVSVSDDVVELIRQVNAMGLSSQERARFITAFCRTAHAAGDSLKLLYSTAPGSAGSVTDESAPIGHVLSRLLPRTTIQAEWIEQLRQGLVT